MDGVWAELVLQTNHRKYMRMTRMETGYDNEDDLVDDNDSMTMD